MIDKYDYIITGAGCAGLSLLRSMMQHAFFNNKKILLLDKKEKINNDRTWCFWEQQHGIFEDIVYHRWNQIDFYSNDFSARFDLQPYTYKMIRGIDLYSTVLHEAKQHANIDVISADVESVSNNENYAIAKTNEKEFYADYIFNSIFFTDWKQEALKQKNMYILLQHFKGLLIETDEAVFDERIATFMDFRVAQNKGTAFAYVLPIANNQALVEYTLFSEKILEQHEYDEALENYIESFLNIKKYSVMHTEFGVIPMTNYNFSKGEGKIINIGTAAGQTKGSSGYTFQFIQKHTDKIINALVNEKNPLLMQSIYEKRFHLYDSILLNVLYHKKMNGDKLFAQLFKKNSPQTILKFLDNETSFTEELKIMNSVSLSKFLPAALKEIFRW
ncbi:MAG: lycopene cyclase family protein [Parafilimonas sp.]